MRSSCKTLAIKTVQWLVDSQVLSARPTYAMQPPTIRAHTYTRHSLVPDRRSERALCANKCDEEDEIIDCGASKTLRSLIERRKGSRVGWRGKESVSHSSSTTLATRVCAESQQQLLATNPLRLQVVRAFFCFPNMFLLFYSIFPQSTCCLLPLIHFCMGCARA